MHAWARSPPNLLNTPLYPYQCEGALFAARHTQYREEAFCKITSFETVCRDFEPIPRWQPDVVVVDEGQRIKNWNTIASRALTRAESPYAIALTGTSLEDLVSFVQLVGQHRFGPTRRLLHNHQMRNETGRVVGYRDLDRIGETLAPILIRRHKSEVLREFPMRVTGRA